MKEVFPQKKKHQNITFSEVLTNTGKTQKIYVCKYSIDNVVWYCVVGGDW